MCAVEKINSFFDFLEKSIIEIENIKTGKVLKGIFNIKNHINKYSSTKENTPTLFLNDVRVKTREYKVLHKCECGHINKIHLSKFLIKTYFKCVKCREDKVKRKNHSDMYKNKLYPKLKIIKPTLTLNEVISQSNVKFSNESDDFKKQYFTKNLTFNEFNKIKKNVISINGLNIVNHDITFEPHLITKNQSKYSQYIIINGDKINLKNVQFICESCGDIYNTTRKLKTKINYYKSLCTKCTFCNKTFKIKQYQTKFNDSIIYQSGLELDFIHKCELNGMKILNGESVEYVFKNKKHVYRIDFYLPEYGYLIEIKGNHIWHREQLKSGVWLIKENSAKEYSKKNNLKYIILFQEEIENFITSIKI